MTNGSEVSRPAAEGLAYYKGDMITRTERDRRVAEDTGLAEPTVLVRVLMDLETFTGTDGRDYDLKREDLVTLPEKNAIVLEKRGAVVVVDVPPAPGPRGPTPTPALEEAKPSPAPDQAVDDVARRVHITTSRQAKAEYLLKNCDVIEYFRSVYSTIHAGDAEIIDSILLAAACQSVVNAYGIQPSTSGMRGTGKSSGVSAALHLFPRDWIVEGSFSDKVLFYLAARPGTIFYSDDTELSPDMNATIKRGMTYFQQETIHRSLNKDKKPVEVNIPPRSVFLFTSTGDQGDDQLNDRQYKISLAKSPDADKAFVQFVKEAAITGREQLPVTEEVMICREIMRLIKSREFRVLIPYADSIKFSAPGERRDVVMFFDFIRAVTVLRFMRREQKHTDGDPESMITLVSEPEDATDANRIFKSNAGTQRYRLTKDERALWEFIAITQSGEIAFPDLVGRYASAGRAGATETNIRRLLTGRYGQGGLCSKVNGLTITQELREVSEGKRRNVKVIRCSSRPEISDYADFAILNLPCPSCPSPVLPCPPIGTGETDFHLSNGQSIDSKYSSSTVSCPADGSAAIAGSASPLCDPVSIPDLGQGRSTPTEPTDYRGDIAEQTPPPLAPSSENLRTGADNVDRGGVYP